MESTAAVWKGVGELLDFDRRGWDCVASHLGGSRISLFLNLVYDYSLYNISFRSKGNFCRAFQAFKCRHSLTHDSLVGSSPLQFRQARLGGMRAIHFHMLYFSIRTFLYQRLMRAQRWARVLSIMTRAPPRMPLVAIIGATGTGKSEVNSGYAIKRHHILTTTGSWRLRLRSGTMARSSTETRCSCMLACPSLRTRSREKNSKGYHIISWDA